MGEENSEATSNKDTTTSRAYCLLIERCQVTNSSTITAVIGCPVPFCPALQSTSQACTAACFLSICSKVGVRKFLKKHSAAIQKNPTFSQQRRMAESEERPEVDEGDSYMRMDTISSKKGNRKRRFSEDQVKSLELMFQTQTKLEPRKKLQLAKELGLHTRQVAIWFQNKRARWKAKQLEREYNALRADYDALLSSFESLKNEKQMLAKQLQKLAELLAKPMEERRKGSDYSKTDDRQIRRDYSKTDERQIRPDLPVMDKTDTRPMSSDDKENQYRQYSEKETEDFFNEPPIGGLLLPSEQQQQQLCFHQPSWLPDQSCATPQWWEFGR